MHRRDAFAGTLFASETSEPVAKKAGVVKTVLLIDDHPVIAVGLGLAIGDRGAFKLIASTTTPLKGRAAVAETNPDAIILDLVFDGVVHLSLVSECRAARPDAAIVVFSSLSSRVYAKETRAAGADDYLAKSADMPMLLASLAAVFARRAALIGSDAGSRKGPRDFAITETVSGDLSAAAWIVQGDVHLTSREEQVAFGLARGLSITLIAREIGISANTASIHRDNLRKKLGCRDTKELVARLARMDAGHGPS